MTERVPLDPEPLTGGLGPGPEDALGQFDRVREIKNAYGIRPVEIDESLAPERAVGDCHHRSRRGRSPAVGFPLARLPKVSASASRAKYDSAPVRSVPRRTVSSPTRTPVNRASRSAAWANGSEAPSSTNRSVRHGVSGLPGRNSNWSFRKKTPAPQAGQVRYDRVSTNEASPWFARCG